MDTFSLYFLWLITIYHSHFCQIDFFFFKGTKVNIFSIAVCHRISLLLVKINSKLPVEARKKSELHVQKKI